MNITTQPRTTPLTCPLCRDGLGAAALTCTRCSTGYHPACFRELGGCSSTTCREPKPALPASRYTPVCPVVSRVMLVLLFSPWFYGLYEQIPWRRAEWIAFVVLTSLFSMLWRLTVSREERRLRWQRRRRRLRRFLRGD